MTGHTILLVDDDTDLTEMLQDYLDSQNFKADAVHDAEAALSQLEQTHYDLIVLDVMMPGMTGLELLPIIRHQCNTPVIMLTGRGDDIDRIIGLEMGADDYIAKPCNPRELVARINAVLRRHHGSATTQPSADASTTEKAASNNKLCLHNLSLDPGQREASYQQQPLNLTTVEFDMLEILMRNAGTPVSKDMLSEKALQRKPGAYDRSIDVHISRLRNKLKQQQKDLELIKTIRGQGYQFISE